MHYANITMAYVKLSTNMVRSQVLLGQGLNVHHDLLLAQSTYNFKVTLTSNQSEREITAFISIYIVLININIYVAIPSLIYASNFQDTPFKNYIPRI